MRYAFGLAILAMLLLAGCTGSDSKNPSTAPPTSSPGDETGSIRGRVMDDESVPVALATVRLLPEDLTVQTDADGAFGFASVQPGNHTIIANKTGYITGQVRLDVIAGEVAQPTLFLTPIPGPDPYSVAHTGALYLHAAYKDVHRLSALAGVSCSPCEHWWRTQPGVSDGLLEVVWTPSVNLPMVNQAFRFGLSVNAWNGSYHGASWIADGDPVWSGVLKSRQGFAFEPHDARKFPKNETITMVHANTPDEVSFGLLQRIDVWLTLAYHSTLPQDHTALPPS